MSVNSRKRWRPSFLIVESMRPKQYVFDNFLLDEKHELGWQKLGHPLVGKSARRIYSDGNAYVDGRIMAYLPSG